MMSFQYHEGNFILKHFQKLTTLKTNPFFHALATALFINLIHLSEFNFFYSYLIIFSTFAIFLNSTVFTHNKWDQHNYPSTKL